MKRSYLLTALVLALAAFTPACDGDKPAGGAEGQPAAAGDDSSSGDPVKDLQAMADGIQKDVDALMQPINDADAAIDAVSNLPKDIKATAKAKAKIDAKFEKKLLAEAKKIVDGQEPDIESLGLEAEVKVKVSGAFDKLKAVVNGIKETDTKAKAIADKVKDAVVKAPQIAAKATAKIEITLKNPLAGSDAKKKAEEDKANVTKIVDSFKTKGDEWTKAVTDLPTKAKAASDKMAKAFTSAK